MAVEDACSLRPEVAVEEAYSLRPEVAAVVAACSLRPAVEEVAAAGAYLTSDDLLTPLSRRVTQPRNCG
jgi:hypothetical protein